MCSHTKTERQRQKERKREINSSQSDRHIFAIIKVSISLYATENRKKSLGSRDRQGREREINIQKPTEKKKS